MTGRIKFMSTMTGSGQIEDEDGLLLPFDFSDVLTYDLPYLTIGQRVSFRPESGKARNISRESRPVTAVPEARKNDGSLRYVGFEQANSVRTFRFERFLLGAPVERFTMSTDLALLAKHHITIQEGPALCLRLLTQGLNEASVVFERALTEADILADEGRRSSASSKNHKRGVASPQPGI